MGRVCRPERAPSQHSEAPARRFGDDSVAREREGRCRARQAPKVLDKIEPSGGTVDDHAMRCSPSTMTQCQGQRVTDIKPLRAPVPTWHQDLALPRYDPLGATRVFARLAGLGLS